MADIEDMVAGYIECAVWAGLDWSDMDESDNPRHLDENYGADDVAPEALATIRDECAQFVDECSDDLAATGADMGQHGHDFYLTRNGHGAGFWDRGYGDAGDRLSDAAKAWGTSELYAGDDGALYVEG